MRNKQQDMGSDRSGNVRSGGLGTSKHLAEKDRGGERGEKRPTNADHDQKIAENRKHILENDDRPKPKGAQDIDENPVKGGGGTADDVLGRSRERVDDDPDRERKSGDIVSGGEHSQFPDSQAGYDTRSHAEKLSGDTNDDLADLDTGKNDDLSRLDRADDAPYK